MTFEDVVKALREDKKVRRTSWSNETYCLFDDPCYECEKDLDLEDVLAEDWEIIDE